MKSSNFAALMKKGKHGKKAGHDAEPPKATKGKSRGRGSSDIALLKRKKMPA